jgi:hypothetical protein
MGRRLLEIYPYVPLSPQNHALSVGLISYDGRVFFGLAGDRDVVPDLDDFASALRAAIREQPVPRRKPAQPKRQASPSRRKAKAKPRARAKPKAKAKPRAKAAAKGRAKPRRKTARRGRAPQRRRSRARR